jgi:hypothetical protein
MFLIDDALPFRVEIWDERDAHVEEVVALVGDHAVARPAFAEAVRRRPGRVVTLRQRTRVLADSRVFRSASVAGSAAPDFRLARLRDIDSPGHLLLQAQPDALAVDAEVRIAEPTDVARAVRLALAV